MRQQEVVSPKNDPKLFLSPQNYPPLCQITRIGCTHVHSIQRIRQIIQGDKYHWVFDAPADDGALIAFLYDDELFWFNLCLLAEREVQYTHWTHLLPV